MDIKFPKIKKGISELINDEEGNIPRTRLVAIGSTIMLMGIILGYDYAYAAHGSHRSHGSHGSHTSHSSTSYHRSHVSHTSHSSSTHGSHSNSHSSHGSHTSHSNTHNSHSSHSNTHSSHASHVSHSNVQPVIPKANTGATHLSGSDYSIPGTKEIPVPEIPNTNDFSNEIPNTISTVSFSINPDSTEDPKLDRK